MKRGPFSQHPFTGPPGALSWKPLSAAIDNILSLSQSDSENELSKLPHAHRSPVRDPLQFQTEISSALLEAQERDRKRIAADLHDSIGQNLSVVIMTIETVLRELAKQSGQEQQQRALSMALTRVRMTIDELRRIALDLRPSMLEEVGLLATLDWCFDEFTESNPGITLVRDIQVEENDIPPLLRCDLFRMVQEALHNVTKHANADKVVLALHRDKNKLVLTIRDDGCGFDPREKVDAGIGLYSMQARSERGGGTLHIDSALGKGTTIKVYYPLPEDIKTKGKADSGWPKRRKQVDRRHSRERRGRSH